MSLTRNILKHSAVYSGVNVLGKLVGFILLPFYAHIFDTEGFGVIGMIDGSIGLLSILFGAASYNTVMRVFHYEEKDAASHRMVISTSLWLIWATSALLIILPLVFSRSVSEFLLATPEYQGAIVLALLTFLLNMGNRGAENYLIIGQRSVTYSLVGIFRMALGVSLNIYLVIVLNIGVMGIFLSSFLTAAVSGAIVHWIAIQNNGLRYDPRTGRELLAIWLPLMPGEVLDYVGRQSELFFVRFLVSLEGVGILEMAYKFPPLLNLFFAQPFLLAWRTKSFEIAGDKDAPVVMGKMFTNMLFVMTAAGLVLAVTIDELLMLLTPESFWGATRIARIGMLTTIIAAANSYFLFGLYQAKQVVKISVIKSSMAVLKVTLSGIVISLSGLQGAALSALIIQTITLVWIFKASQGYYRVEVEYGRVASTLGIAVAIASVIEYAQRTDRLIGSQLVTAGVSGVLQMVGGDGRIVSALNEKTAVLANFLIEGALASVFALGVFILRPELRRSLIRRASDRISSNSGAADG